MDTFGTFDHPIRPVLRKDQAADPLIARGGLIEPLGGTSSRETEEHVTDQRGEAALAGLVASDHNIETSTQGTEGDLREVAVADGFHPPEDTSGFLS